MGKGKLSTFPEDIKEDFVKKMSFIWSLKTKCLPGRQIREEILGRQAISFYFLHFFLTRCHWLLSPWLKLFSLEGHHPITSFSGCIFSLTLLPHFTLLITVFSLSIIFSSSFFKTYSCFWKITQLEVWKIDDIRETGYNFIVLIKVRNYRA